MASLINARGNKSSMSGGATLKLVLGDGTVYPRTGKFLAADREIDVKTGTIRISAAFPNPDRILRPGQYGRVRAETGEQKDALLVPQRAVSELQGSFQVHVVGPDNKVSTKTVKVGERLGSRWVDRKWPRSRRPCRRRRRAARRHRRHSRTVYGAGRGALSHVALFCRPPHRRHRHRHRHRARGAGIDAGAADRAIPRNHPAADQRVGELHRRRRADDRIRRRHAARAADQRRRQHALHGVDQRQRRHHAADGDVRRRDRSEHRSGQRPEPHRAGAAEPAAGRQYLSA